MPRFKAQLERAGFKVEVQVTDWTTMVNRLVAKKGPPSEGGWNSFATRPVRCRSPSPPSGVLRKSNDDVKGRPRVRSWRPTVTGGPDNGGREWQTT
jgi:ABC-type transport system substrate-binding protein